MTALYWLGPLGLLAGSLSSIVAIFFAHAALGLPLPSGSPRTERWIVPLWIAGVALLALRCTVLSGTPALLAEILYSTYPFLIALGLSPALLPAIPETPVAQETQHGGRHRHPAGGRN
jgi:hypothetical protein